MCVIICLSAQVSTKRIILCTNLTVIHSSNLLHPLINVLHCFGGGPSLITCQVKGCDCLLHHMCKAEWESAKEGRKAHGSRKLCAHHHPACPVVCPSCAAFSSPPAATLGSSKSTMSTLTTTTASVSPRNINLAAESNDKNVNGELPILQEDDAEELPPP
jgi:hypothetical protein